MQYCQQPIYLLFVQTVQEKIDVLNERLEAANMAGGTTKEDTNDSLDSMQAWKQSVKKCKYVNMYIKKKNINYCGLVWLLILYTNDQ